MLPGKEALGGTHLVQVTRTWVRATLSYVDLESYVARRLHEIALGVLISNNSGCDMSGAGWDLHTHKCTHIYARTHTHTYLPASSAFVTHGVATSSPIPESHHHDHYPGNLGREAAPCKGIVVLASAPSRTDGHLRPLQLLVRVRPTCR